MSLHRGPASISKGQNHCAEVLDRAGMFGAKAEKIIAFETRV